MVQQIGEIRECEEEKTGTVLQEYDDKPALWLCRQPTSSRSCARTKLPGLVATLETMAREGASLEGVGAYGLDLSSARSGKPRISLAEADLKKANLHRSHLEDADLRSAKLMDARMSHTCLGGANLSRADLTETNLEAADLGGADLSSATLKNAKLKEAMLRHVNLTGADLGGADLTRVNLKDAKGLTQDQLDVACANPEEEPPLVPKGLEWRSGKCPRIHGTSAT